MLVEVVVNLVQFLKFKYMIFDDLETYLQQNVICENNDLKCQYNVKFCISKYLETKSSIKEYWIICDNSNNGIEAIDNNFLNVKIEYTTDMKNYKIKDLTFKLPFNKNLMRKRKIKRLLKYEKR